MLHVAGKWPQFLWIVGAVWCFSSVNVLADIEHNTINEDGSYSFRHTNDDIGSYYHSASASPDNIVRGRYGSRNPATGQVDEVVYTAGPRGFRANGPKIHRKMDLAQYPVRPRGSPDDPLADPYDDPSYSFSYRASDQSRSENSDATGRVRGLYSYLDDVGERHTVRYAAGAGTGFEVLNSVPDNPISVAYAAPLYKAPPKTRGKMSVQRGPDGTYKLIAAGPDHRRAESRGADGVVRGTYSYLDDVGVQRTVEYIAGPGIGYRIVKNRMGPGTHINPSITEFRLSDTDFKLANDFGRGAGGGELSGAGSGGGRTGAGAGGRRTGGDRRGGSGSGGGSGGGGGEYLKKDNEDDRDLDDRDNDIRSDDDDGDNRRGGSSSGSSDRERTKADRMGSAVGNRGGTRYRGGSSDSSTFSTSGSSDSYDSTRNRGGSSANRGGSGTGNRNRDRDRDRNSSSSDKRRGGGGSSSTSSRDNGGYNYEPPSTNNYHFNDDDVGSLPPLITANRKILEIDRERDWVQRHHDSTVIKNVGKWYIGLPPGQSVRAHVQNIDLLPLGGRRVPSPSEALRQDEIADMVASLETNGGNGS